MKLTNKQIKEIHRLRESGKNQTEIGNIMGVSQKAISYWLMDEGKRKDVINKSIQYFKNLSKEKRSEIYKKRLPYLKMYRKNRYSSDKEFREKEKKRARKNKEVKK